MASIKKTNAMRILDKLNVDYKCLEYEYDENDLDGHHVADYLKLPYEEVFKTLVTKSDVGGIYVFCLSVDDELDLKKAARLVKVKRLEMLPVKELLAVTGYIRGGCSPVGIRKPYPVTIDEMVELIDEISISGGMRGLQIRIKTSDLLEVTKAKIGDITK